MRTFLTIYLLFISLQGNSQVEFLSCGSNGELIKSTTTVCCEENIGDYRTFVDIAITPNGNIYGLDSSIYLIDTSNISVTLLTTPIDINGNYSAGTGLVAINNEYLISDKDDSLFLIDITSGSAINLGYTGYYCNGDFAFLNDYLYMAADPNDLIKFKLHPVTFEILEVTNIGSMNQNGSVYSLFTTFQGYGDTQKSLFAIDGKSIFEVNTSNGNLTHTCNFNSNHESFGGASIYDFNNQDDLQIIPNVFTPNNDGINDYFIIPETYDIKSFSIINRWGNIVYKYQDGDGKWDGRNLSGEYVKPGVYFYSIKFDSCNDSHQLNGNITILK